MISAWSWICAFSSRNVQAKNASSAVAPTTTLPWPRICATRWLPSARDRSAAWLSFTTRRGLSQVGTPVQRNEPCRNTGFQRLAGDAERAGMRRVQMAHAHGIGPVAMDLRVNAPFQRDQAAGMLDDGAVDIVGENLLRRTVVLSVLAPGLMKHLSVPGTRIETWPNIPIVPCMFSMRVSVAVFSRNSVFFAHSISSICQDLPQVGVA